MATVLEKVTAGFSDQLEPGDGFRHAVKVKFTSRLSLGRPTVKGVKLPEVMVWATTNHALFVFTADKLGGATPKKLLLVLPFRTEVEFLDSGKQVRELPIAVALVGTRLDVALPADGGMAMARFLRTQAPPAWVTPVDPYVGDARSFSFVEALRHSDWPAAEAILAQPMSVGERANLFMGTAFGLVTGRPEGLDAWVAARPDSAPAHLVRGAHGVTWAWEIRGSGYASTVKADAWDIFHTRLRDAESDLFRAAELDPTDGTPWAQLLISGRGLSIPKEELLLRFHEAISRSPELTGAYFQALQGLCAKWAGSHDDMFGFARQHAGGAADGSHLHGLISAAHLEMWAARPKEDPPPRPYFTDPDVRAELVAHAQRSVLHPAWVDEPQTVSTLNSFACLLRLAGETELAHQVALRIGTRRTSSPWVFFKNADELFMKTQTNAPVAVASR